MGDGAGLRKDVGLQPLKTYSKETNQKHGQFVRTRHVEQCMAQTLNSRQIGDLSLSGQVSVNKSRGRRNGMGAGREEGREGS